MSLSSYFVSWKVYLFISKKNTFMNSTEMIIPFRMFFQFRHVFCRINFCDVGRHLMEKMWNLFLRSQRFNKFFSGKSKKEDRIYMGIIYMSFLSRNLLCKNIYTMSSFMWSNELFSILKWWLYLYCIFLFTFLIYEASYLKNFRNVEFIFAIGFETVFCGTCSCNWLIQNCIDKTLWYHYLSRTISG